MCSRCSDSLILLLRESRTPRTRVAKTVKDPSESKDLQLGQPQFYPIKIGRKLGKLILYQNNGNFPLSSKYAVKMMPENAQKSFSQSLVPTVTPAYFVFAKTNALVKRSIWVKNVLNLAEFSILLCLFKVALEALRALVLGSLGRRLVMTCTKNQTQCRLCQLSVFARENGKQIQSFQYILGLKPPRFVTESFLFRHRGVS